jgi:ABC-2 type transport system permease protein
MSTATAFSFARLWAMVVKEFIQMSRDRLTFAMILGIPLMQLTVFGFVINTDPRHMPAAILIADDGPQGRTLLHGLKNSSYFDFERRVTTEAEGEELLRRGQVQFVVSIPENFSRDLLRGDRPAVLVEADATDPTATSGGLAALAGVVNTAMLADF